MSKNSRRARKLQRFGLAAAFAAFSAAALAAGDVGGRYSILRDEDKDTGCMLTLDTRARGPGGNKAQLAPACRDNGVVIFDPVGWTVDHGRLVLTARKGHKAHFERDSNGVWRRDAKEGKALGLKPM
ncbi:protease inhibitor Inh/omp19 family protein [Methylocystis sp. WRRC1]|uniref:AprI/Inh family metalloprotease inhibitor n=1 Tax=unclassified Methylocystis TaxID=2625913 RepID=UPI0001F8862D|nr:MULTISPECIES: AprI/Inh family metalloprotease inhibitor [unclassified Methylocystis]MCC3247123.1 protease inhibitor Inh/omp19 family protein [Methylocystis sp. WRRC1]